MVEIVEVEEVVVEGVGDGFVPGFLAEGGEEFVLREADGLKEGLGEEGEGAGSAGSDVAASDGSEEAREGEVKIAGGDAGAGEERGERRQ